MVDEIPVTQARAEFADLVNRVTYGGERIVVTRHGRPIVALVPAADLDRLEGDDADHTVVRLSGPAVEQGPVGRQAGSGRRHDVAARHGRGDGPAHGR
ncbi:MAG: type II toxin-antitoxin system Phd/YefM family antitoxin [Actinocatenispora sp.]